MLPPVGLVAEGVLSEFGIPRSVLTYVNYPTSFDSRQAQAALSGTDIRVPPLEGYADKLWDYWERHLDPDLFRDRTLVGAVRGRAGAVGGATQIIEQQIPDELLRLVRRVLGTVSLEQAVRGRVVMVTGASSGIGRSAALKIADAGGIVLLVARTAEKLEETKAQIEDGGGRAHVHALRPADMDDIDRMADEVLAQHGHVDILVNNAGRSIRRSIALSYDRFHDFERTMQLNYFGAVKLILKLLPVMRERRSGQIVNISSIGVQTNTPRFSAYVASKAALDAFSRCVASEIVDEGVAITTIHMPLVRTPMISPTKMYNRFPTITPEKAADMICEAIIYRPKRIATPLGTLGQILYSINPKSMDYILNSAYKLFPDSRAARGEKRESAPGTADDQRGGVEGAGRLRLPDEGRSLVSTATRRRKHWGWGFEDQALTREQLEAAAPGVREQLGFGATEVEEAVPLEAIELRPPRVEPPASLAHLFRSDPYERVSHALGRGYRDVVRGFRGRIPDPPDLVAYPGDEDEIEAVLAWCAKERVAAIPYGGGTSVVGGVEPRIGDAYRGAVTIDLRGLERVLEVDEVSRAARIQAGATGPALEDQLRERGLTLRHFPQSFEFSTLGGWIATRAGGHFATLYTHIDDLVESVRAITPGGRWESRRLPGSGAGPSPDRLLLGSEGILGVITEAWVRVRERPRWKLSTGSRSTRSRPAPKRSESSRSPDSTPRTAVCSTQPSPRSRTPDRRGRLCWCSGSSPRTIRSTSRCGSRSRSLRDHGGRKSIRGAGRRESEGDAVGAWRHAFLAAPYLRDTLVALGVLSDTFETAITWDRFEDFHAGVMETARAAIAEACGVPPNGPGSPRLSCRFTHVYPDGPAPYYTVLCPAKRGGEVEQWDEVKAAVSERVIDAGGTITHHHAVGRDHRPWYDRQRPDPFAEALRAAKRAVDPGGVLNPGVLVDP